MPAPNDLPGISDTPRVDVVVVSYESGRQLASCLDAIAADRPTGAGIIVVDNASPDESERIARDHPSRPLVIESDRNIGFGGGCNLGAQSSSAEFLFFLNPDARPRRGAIRALVHALAANPSVAAIGPRITAQDGSLAAASAGFHPSLRSAIGHFLFLGRVPLLRSLFPPLQLPPGAPFQPVDWVGGAAIMVRASHFRDVRGFDASMFLYMEDVDLCRRLRARGHLILYDPAVVVDHDVGGSQGDAQPARWFRAFHAYLERQRGSAYARLVSVIAAVGLGFRAAAFTVGSPVRAKRLRIAAKAAASEAISRRRRPPSSEADPVVSDETGLPTGEGRALDAAAADPRPDRDRVGAVFVTYHPDDAFDVRVLALSGQVSRILIVDNGSSSEAVTAIERLAKTQGVEAVFNASNVGLAAALNQGLGWGEQQRLDWVATFDQDTLPGPNLVAEAGKVFDAHQGKPIAAIGAGWQGTPEQCENAGGIEVPAVITSGTLHSVAIWRALRGFREDFFVDLVDTEFCLRARSGGYHVVRSCLPTMSHDVGRPSRRRLVFRSVTPSNHSRARRYYMTRNRIRVWRAYARREPSFVIRDVNAAGKELVKLVLFEDGKRGKLGAMVRGTVDGIRGKGIR
jgi:GT2 family glycosyltransferase